jgi:hypothetical protein
VTPAARAHSPGLRLVNVPVAGLGGPGAGPGPWQIQSSDSKRCTVSDSESDVRQCRRCCRGSVPEPPGAQALFRTMTLTGNMPVNRRRARANLNKGCGMTRRELESNRDRTSVRQTAIRVCQAGKLEGLHLHIQVQVVLALVVFKCDSPPSQCHRGHDGGPRTPPESDHDVASSLCAALICKPIPCNIVNNI